MTGLFAIRFITWQHGRIHDETHSPNHHFPLIPNYLLYTTYLFISSFYFIILADKTATKITNIEFYECGAPLFCKYPNRECINTSTRLGFCFSGGYLMHHTTPFFLSIYIFLCTHLLMANICMCVWTWLLCVYMYVGMYIYIPITTSFTVLITPPMYIFTPFTCTFYKKNLSLDSIHFTVIKYNQSIYCTWSIQPLLDATIIQPIPLVPIHCIYNTTILFNHDGLFTIRFITWQNGRIYD